MWWQMLKCEHLFYLYSEKFNVVDKSLTFDNLRLRTIQDKLAKLRFDLHLPDTCNTQDERMIWVLAQRKDLWWQFLRFAVPPDENLCVEQQLHAASV